MDYITLLIGIFIGGIIGWIVKPKKSNDREIELAQANKFIAQQKQDIQHLRDENMKFVAAAAAKDQEVKTLKEIRENMLKEFKLISGNVIDEQKKSMADTQKTVLKPVADEMEKMKLEFDAHIKNMLEKSTENKTSIDEQIKNMLDKSDALHKEAGNLANALKNKKTQGCWGETYLETVLQMLGFVENTDYSKEVFFRSDEKDIRPDFILHLPNNKKIIIDSKVSLESYLNYENAETDEDKERYANEFIKSTESHIEKLAAKDYQKKVKDSGLDYVFMFMPIESAYILAMKRKPELYYGAQKKNVALITSSLLFPVLKTVDMLLKIDKQNKNISEVVDMVNKLYEKYVGFTTNFADVGKKIKGAQDSYDDALKQLSEGNGNMSVWFDKIKIKSGITTNKSIAIEYKDE